MKVIEVGTPKGMNKPLQVRLAASEDAPMVSRILRESFAEFEPLYTPGGFAATTPDAHQVRARMKEGPIWIAYCDLDAVGTVAAVLKGESVYIRGMAVVPSKRKCGAATQLLAHVEGWSVQKDCNRLFLSTTPFLHAAIRMYEKSGFKPIDDGRQDPFGTPLFTMEKWIASEK